MSRTFTGLLDLTAQPVVSIVHKVRDNSPFVLSNLRDAM
jgi:hypothetical protein